MNKKNVHTLDSVISENRTLIAIASHENDYRISWALNQTLKFQFVKSENLIVFNKRFNENQEFSMYLSPESEEQPFCRLISNRCENGFLLEDMRNIDFILIVENGTIPIEKTKFILDLRSISFISAAFEIAPNSSKNLGRLKT